MRILLISANREPFPEPVFPLGAAYVGGALQRSGAVVRIFDMRHARFPWSLEKEISDFRPDRIGISLRNVDNAAYPFFRYYLPEYADLVGSVRKVSDVPIILGGSAYSLFPEEIGQTLRPDAGMVGEGEDSAVFFREGARGAKRYEDDLQHGPGSGPGCGLASGSVSFPRNIRELFPSFGRYRTIGVQTGRGCPNRCVYCTYPSLEGRRRRNRDPEAVADEIMFLRRDHGVRNFFVVDALFNADEGHMVKVLEALVRRRPEVRLSCYLQPRISDPGIFGLLKEAGCVAVDFGTDSGSPEALASLRKPFTTDDIRRASLACGASGIDYCHSLVFGTPAETSRSVRETVALMDELSPRAVVAMTGIRIYPGTEIERVAVREGVIEDGASLLEPRFYFPQMGPKPLLDDVYDEVGGRNNWFFPGRKDWSATLGYRMLQVVYRKGPLWRTFRK